ncbi:hypothetical protein [Peribacillus sp. NPDC096540]|uniref:hypothetical protein n=1 Tax=Peribacillus sp. NPDC096540 TaxID=3390612 RepID=UPI003CFF8E9A
MWRLHALNEDQSFRSPNISKYRSRAALHVFSFNDRLYTILNMERVDSSLIFSI